VQELTGGEDKPVFATLPIGMINVVSGNQRYYDEKFVQEQEKQVREKKPIGLMGHLSQSDRATAFPMEAVHWVGVQRVNEILWGKGYFPDGEPRKRLQRYKATNKKIATSIDASADGVWDSKLGAYRMIAETLELNQIDIAPADRAGIGDLAAVPMITTEMLDRNNGTGSYTVKPIQEDTMGKEETIKEMTAADASLLPESVRSAIAGSQLQEFRKALGLPEGADVFAAIASINTNKEETAKKAVSLKITEMVSDPEKGIKVEAVRKTVQELVEARMPKTPEEAQTAYEEVVKSEHVQELLKIAVQTAMGPSVSTPIPGQNAPSSSGKYFTSAAKN
jgi:hypothetical protein